VILVGSVNLQKQEGMYCFYGGDEDGYVCCVANGRWFCGWFAWSILAV